MLRFLFGRGAWVTWYVVMYVVLVVGVLLPTLMFLPLKKPGEKPDTPSLGSVFVVVWMAGALAVVTLVNTGIVARVLQANLIYKGLLAVALATGVAVAAYHVAALLATDQSRRAMTLWCLAAGALVLGNLWAAWFGLSRQAGSIRAPAQWFVWALLGALALPVAYFTFMLLLGMVLQKMGR